MKVLIVEDEEEVASLIKIILTKEFGLEGVVIAKDGEEAWDQLRTEAYDLIISDWNMPRKGGDELLYEVRQHWKTKDIPFLMLTARATIYSVKTATGLGASDYLVKPFNKRVLVETIRNLCGSSLCAQPAFPPPSQR